MWFTPCPHASAGLVGRNGTASKLFFRCLTAIPTSRTNSFSPQGKPRLWFKGERVFSFLVKKPKRLFWIDPLFSINAEIKNFSSTHSGGPFPPVFSGGQILRPTGLFFLFPKNWFPVRGIFFPWGACPTAVLGGGALPGSSPPGFWRNPLSLKNFGLEKNIN